MLPQGNELRCKPDCCHTQDCFIFSRDRPIVQGITRCHHKCTNPAKSKALPHEGALALVRLFQVACDGAEVYGSSPLMHA